MKYSELSKDKLNDLVLTLRAEFEECKKAKLSLDISRGRPSEDQLALSSKMISCLSPDDYMAGDIDCRNYGGLDGLPEMKKIFADIFDMLPEQIIVGGNSSLSMMFESIAANMTHGVRDGEPWLSQGKVKFLCPVPGYDRHFAICDYFHIEMIPVPMDEHGPDMDMVEKLTAADPMIKGIWCVPKYSNPEGIFYSDEVVRRIAGLKPAAPDFRIYWDDAYIIHHLYGTAADIPHIILECENAGNPHMAYIFTSFSKISFGGSAVACMGSSVSNIEYIKSRIRIQTLGPDKINQLRHVRFFGSAKGVIEHMKRHAAILRPKFELIHEIFERELAPLGICRFREPKGGYFLSFYTMDNCAKKVVAYCKECGLTLTPAGATYPYGIDPRDSNIRIAPSYPSLSDIKQAIDVFCLCVKLASAEALMITELDICDSPHELIRKEGDDITYSKPLGFEGRSFN